VRPEDRFHVTTAPFHCLRDEKKEAPEGALKVFSA
jgi:hypothetical protein